MRTQAALLSSIHASYETNCTHVLAKAVSSVEPAEFGQAVKLEMSNTPQFVMVLCQLDQLIAQTGSSCSGAYNASRTARSVSAAAACGSMTLLLYSTDGLPVVRSRSSGSAFFFGPLGDQPLYGRSHRMGMHVDGAQPPSVPILQARSQDWCGTAVRDGPRLMGWNSSAHDAAIRNPLRQRRYRSDYALRRNARGGASEENRVLVGVHQHSLRALGSQVVHR